MNLINDIDWDRWGAPALTALRIFLILVLAWLAMRLLYRMVRLVRERAERHMGATEASRAATLARVVKYIIAVVIGAVAFMLVLGQIGISLAPILGAAGVVGLAIGFGAQSLVKDYFTGFFILLEDQIRTGDVVKVAGIAGGVEDITLRHVRLRDYEGTVHYIPNNLITTVSNMTRHFSNAVLEVGVGYRENVDEVMAVMHEVARQMREDTAWKDIILDDLEMAGLERLDQSAVVIRARLRTVASQQWGVRREYLRRMKAAFNAKDIELPFPHVTVYAGVDKDGAAPALPLNVMRPPRKAVEDEAQA
ncbi:mechanosensitive ion channel family protein [Variovorax dokdonensis]|uniref:Mechanosensitive ion channel family protein n=1 Tax=Variovorax dokdonensis TaxID=344883 RepID=A0ABT7N9A4_9BURK|nr:mechanosensitive ion channel family protein [Variovorax dokdonensis]MDM0044450.1 mechanosensitive ion channel family protein [Variovorax dokdonensis]